MQSSFVKAPDTVSTRLQRVKVNFTGLVKKVGWLDSASVGYLTILLVGQNVIGLYCVEKWD
jgi:hypothetical protein